MGITKRNQLTVFLLWLFIVPAGTIFILLNYPPVSFDWTMLGLLALAIVTVYFPLNLNGKYLSLEQWVGVVVFLKYGISAELVLVQLTIIPLLFRSTSSAPILNRYFFNSLMSFLLSVISGIVYISIGGEFGHLDLSNILLFGFIYQLTYTLFNHLILNTYLKIIGQKVSLMSIDTVWDYLTIIFIFPFSVALYFLEATIGIVALAILGLPFITITLIIQKYNNSERINKDLKIAGEIGHQLADRLTSDEVIRLFLHRVVEMFEIDYAYILDRVNNELILLKSYEKGEYLKLDVAPLQYGEGIGGIVWEKNKPILYNKKSDWIEVISGYFPEDAQSIMASPISRNKKPEGVLVIASEKKNAFDEYQLKILDLLCSYLAVSLEKARYVQETVSISERCGLTKLYNYRFLDSKIEEEMKKVLNGELRQLSLIMMDIDHFKSINDTYGHQSGNDILFSLARLIEREVGSIGTIARYGGEEFVILLPNYSKKQSFEIAEHLRQTIEKHPFEIKTDLDDERELQRVHITMSIGVTTAPEDSDEAMSLIRNADRALYIGAKREGRNRVAEYVK